MSLTPPDLVSHAGRVRRRKVVLVAYPGMQVLDLAGPHEVFVGATRLLDHQAAGGGYDVHVASVRPGSIASESGLVLIADSALPGGVLDTAIVPGGDGVLDARRDPDLVSWVADAATRSRRMASVCSGAFVLAEAGLLDGRRVTTHWSRAARLAVEYPAVTVDADPIFIEDGPIWTSAGVTAGIDLALAMVERDHGGEVAQTIARSLVMFLRRPGGQSQFATPTWTRLAERPIVRAAQERINADPAGDHRIHVLAATVGTSTRTLGRLFTGQVGETPARYVERVRVDHARALLETERLGLAPIARRCGFGTTETMRTAFLRRVGVTPDDYRRRFTRSIPDPEEN